MYLCFWIPLWFFSRIPPSLYPEYHKEDEDVSAERARVTENTTTGNSVTVSNLSKVHRVIFKKLQTMLRKVNICISYIPYVSQLMHYIWALNLKLNNARK